MDLIQINTFKNALLVLSSNNQIYQIINHTQILTSNNYQTFIDIATNQINTIFNTPGPFYQTITMFLPLYYFQTQPYIFYIENTITPIIYIQYNLIQHNILEIYQFSIINSTQYIY